MSDQAIGAASSRNPLNNGTLRTYSAGIATDYAAGPPGVLGEMPPVRLGYWDTRPDEGIPANMAGNKDWLRFGIRPVRGDFLTLKVNMHPASNYFGASLRTLHDLFRFGALSVIVTSFDDPNDFPIGKITGDPTALANTTTNITMRQAWIGPNVLPQLAGAGEAILDLRQWSGGGRFVACWLWSYWVNVAALPDLPIAFEVWDDRPAPHDLAWPVSYPVRTVVDGAFPADPTDAELAFRWGQLPRATGYRLGIANGSSFDLEVLWRQFAGAAAFDDSAEVIVAGDQSVLPAVGGGPASGAANVLRGYSHHFLYAGNEGAEGALGGPAIFSIVARDTG